MSTWLLSIAGVVIVGALVEVLLSDSSIHKFVRSIYAFFVLFVIAQPIPGFFRDTVSSIETSGVIELDYGLIETINSKTASAIQKNVMRVLENAGFDDVIVTIETEKQSNFRITAVYINALGTKFDKKQDIIKIVCAICNVSEEVVFYAG